MRKVLIEEKTRPGRRALLTEPADAGVTKTPVQGELDLEADRGDVLQFDTEAFLGITDWFSCVSQKPSKSGWYEVKVEGEPFPFPNFNDRFWFDLDRQLWGWYDAHGKDHWYSDTTMKLHSWRGLQNAWPWGYHYYVPGGRRHRAQLMIGIVT